MAYILHVQSNLTGSRLQCLKWNLKHVLFWGTFKKLYIKNYLTQLNQNTGHDYLNNCAVGKKLVTLKLYAQVWQEPHRGKCSKDKDDMYFWSDSIEINFTKALCIQYHNSEVAFKSKERFSSNMKKRFVRYRLRINFPKNWLEIEICGLWSKEKLLVISQLISVSNFKLLSLLGMEIHHL